MQGIARILIKVPTLFYVANGVPVTFKALPDPAGYLWQSGGLSWTGATPGTDQNIATATLNTGTGYVFSSSPNN